MESIGWGTLHVWEKWEMPTGVYAEVFSITYLRQENSQALLSTWEDELK